MAWKDPRPVEDLFHWPASNPPRCPCWLWLSPAEAAICRVVRRYWQSARRLARRSGQGCTPVFHFYLRQLVERNLLEHRPGRGYRANRRGPGRKPWPMMPPVAPRTPCAASRPRGGPP
jgi:hypothetical protein